MTLQKLITSGHIYILVVEMTFFNAGVYFLGEFIDLIQKTADIVIVFLLSTFKLALLI